MLTKTINIYVALLLALSPTGIFAGLCGGTVDFVLPGNVIQLKEQHPCDIADHCNPMAPKCPLCPSWTSLNGYLLHESEDYLPPPLSAFIMTQSETFSDQGVVRTVYHPPPHNHA